MTGGSSLFATPNIELPIFDHIQIFEIEEHLRRVNWYSDLLTVC